MSEYPKLSEREVSDFASLLHSFSPAAAQPAAIWVDQWRTGRITARGRDLNSGEDVPEFFPWPCLSAVWRCGTGQVGQDVCVCVCVFVLGRGLCVCV